MGQEYPAGTRGSGAAVQGSIQAYSIGATAISPLAVPDVRFVRFNALLSRRLAAAMHIADDVIHERRALGNRSYVAQLENGEIAGYGWVSLDSIHISELELNIQLPRGHAYIWDCATLPPYRGRGVFPGLLRFMLEDLRLHGIVQVWAAVEPGNVSSLKAFAHAGFRQVARASLAVGRFWLDPTEEATPDEVATMRALRERTNKP